jgi:YVTN family beta-propeller protein
MKRLLLFALMASTLCSISWATVHTPLVFLKNPGVGEEVQHLFWQQIIDGQPIPFAINDQGTPDVNIAVNDPAIDEFEALTLAFEAWEQVPGVPITFNLTSTTTNDFGFDGENVIFFADRGNVGYGGTTMVTFDNQTGQLLDVDIHMNDFNIEWITSGNDIDGEPLECPCEGVDNNAVYLNDIQGLATHEVGHAIGLDHSAVGIRASATTPTMYPLGIWGVPGDGTRPPNSRYRTIELDDIIGVQNLYPPPGWDSTSAKVFGVVHDSQDLPIFGAHVVARNLSTGVEVGAMSGVLDGPYQEGAYSLQGLPDGTYELRAEPIDGTPPSYVSRYNYGGFAGALIPAKFPSEIDLPTTYHRFVFEIADATAVPLAAGDCDQVDFRPIASFTRIPRFIRLPQALTVEGIVNVGLTGPLIEAKFLYTVDGSLPIEVVIANPAVPFSVVIPQSPAGTLFSYALEVETLSTEVFQTQWREVQVGLTGEPLVMVSKQGGARVSAVDTGTMFEVEDSIRGLSYPIGMAFHSGKFGIYVASYGYDFIHFVPFVDGQLPPLNPQPFDIDGDGLLDDLEPIFGTDVADPDSDDDLTLDGGEISKLTFTHNNAGNSGFTVLGGTVANDGVSPLGSPQLKLAVRNVTDSQWESPAMAMTVSGRFRLVLPAGKTYYVSYRNNLQGIMNTPSFTAAAGETISVGVTQIPLQQLVPQPADSGTDPLDEFDGAAGVFRPDIEAIPIDPGVDPYEICLSPDQAHLFFCGHGSDRVYKIDTATNQVVADVLVGDSPKGIALNADGSKIYVANTAGASVSVIDSASMTLLSTLPVVGNPHFVALSDAGDRIIVTSGGSTDLHAIDTATDTMIQEFSSGLGGLFFLSQPKPGVPYLVAGDFQVGDYQLARIEPATLAVQILDLGTQINATSGIALHPDGDVGYVVHYLNPQLLEFSLTTGAVVRSLDFGWVDIRDIMVIEGITSPDCNSNGIRDDLDILAGTSLDQNQNEIPDECEEPLFVRGDSNGDGGINLADAINSLFFTFNIPGGISPCDDASDVNDDGILNLADGIFLLNYLFPPPAPPPPEPFPNCGIDPTLDGLDCASFPPCP